HRLWPRGVGANETAPPSMIQAKQNAFIGIAASLKQNNPDVYSLFQGKQWTTRLEIAFAAIFAALIAGLLVLLIAITLIILKLGFLLLLVVGPFFLIVGTHPGFGRVVAILWVEMLIGVLLKQAAVALVLSVLLYAVGYGVVGSRERAEAEVKQARSTGRQNTLDAATAGVPGFGAYRAARWGRRNPGQAAALAAQVAVGAGAGVAAGASAASGAAAGATPGED